MRATAKVLLTMLDKSADSMLVLSKSESVRRIKNLSRVSFSDEWWKAYYESTVKDRLGKLERRGWVEIKETEEETEVRIKEGGRTELLKYKLSEMKLKVPEKWDKKWRLVMFDVLELERGKRDLLRKWLVRLGLKQIQKSVWIYPYPLEKEIKFLREVLKVPHGVKLITAEIIENDLELREMFDL